MKILNRILLAIGLIVAVPLISLLDVEKFESIFDIVFTYLSITVGFVITSVTIIASSSFSKVLYSVQVKNNNSKTLLHQLLDTLYLTLIFYSIPMMLILIFPILPWPTALPTAITTSPLPVSLPTAREIYDALLIYLTLLTFPVLFVQFRKILGFILQNAKNL